MKKYKKKDSKRQEAIEIFFGYFLVIDIPLFLISLILSMIIKDFLWQQILIKLTIGFFGLIVLFGTVALIANRAKSFLGNIFQKLFGSFLALLFTFVVLSSFFTAFSLYQDKDLYAKGNFENVVGVAKNVTFRSPKHDPNEYIWQFDLEGKSFTLENRAITEEVYEEFYKGKKISVTYLPESRFVVDLTLIEGE
ncbi:hypothetical protein [Psychrobacillus lasiicapitis]|uniref:DUF3592 domain-containing protein n=1 Tax=Psychrobacillus lasiicapitis TaxID=1636719 RepID=A0A544T1H4_9BACI|nr:hypothetical protein [Psychrobacillus lasiicapitis]TQR11298.1 hypothetical protein FG382_15200 [Psychrobacillus lasiicapitis]GGA41707.1 hypothetical protein GCM10011384_34290 [Psychrobacillus lasiicapitis]